MKWLLSTLMLLLLGIVGCGQPAGPVLEYAPDSKLSAEDMDRLVSVVTNRINSNETIGSVSTNAKQHLEIQVYGTEDQVKARVAKIDRLLQQPGEVELRILASYGIPSQSLVISHGLTSPGKEIRDGKKKLRGYWIPVLKNASDGTLGYEPSDYSDDKDSGKNWRRSKSGDIEVVVLDQPYDVTGEHIALATATEDSTLLPAIGVTFSPEGAKRIRRLTSKHLPDGQTGRAEQLGIILNGVLISAPRIQSEISDQAMISGNFTKLEVEELVAALNSGKLPTTLRRVSK